MADEDFEEAPESAEDGEASDTGDKTTKGGKVTSLFEIN